jgi:serine/threonine-protein kinase ULK/ATG1
VHTPTPYAFNLAFSGTAGFGFVGVNEMSAAVARTRQHQVGSFTFSSPHVARGAFSRVYKGHDTVTGRLVAVKHVKLQKCSRERIDTEVAVMRRLGAHPNIVQLLGVFEDTAHNAIFLVLEWCDGGDLAGVLQRFVQAPHQGLPSLEVADTTPPVRATPSLPVYTLPPPSSPFTPPTNKRLTAATAAAPTFSTAAHEHTVRDYMLQIRAATMHLDAHQVLHRDFKPSNVLLHRDPDTGHIVLKLCDFGLATYYGSDKVRDAPDAIKENVDETPIVVATAAPDMFGTMCGSPLYIAPEIVLGKGYTTQSDLWSIGIVLHELLAGVSPFAHNRNQMQHFQKLSQLSGSIDLPPSRAHEPFGGACRALARALLTVDPTQRPTWQAFFDHAWFHEDSSPDSGDDNFLLDVAASAIAEEDNLDIIDDQEAMFQFDDDHHHQESPFVNTPMSSSPQVMEEFEQRRREREQMQRASSSVYDEFQVSTSPGMLRHIIHDYASSSTPSSVSSSHPLAIPVLGSSAGSSITHASFRGSIGSPGSLPSSFSFSSLYGMRVPRVVTHSFQALKDKLSSLGD